jgi:predicted nicotinamide N-methyase
VVLADRDPAAAECAALSAQATLENSSSSSSSNNNSSSSCIVSSRVVDWEEAAAASGSGDGNKNRFDVVLASDVLYDASAALPLSRALRALVKQNGEGVVLVADPAKRAPTHRAAFAEEVTRSKKRERDPGDGPLILESWEAVDEANGERVGGGASAAGAVLLMRLRSSGGSSTLSVRWP